MNINRRKNSGSSNSSINNKNNEVVDIEVENIDDNNFIESSTSPKIK